MLVFDSSTLILLAKTELLDVLLENYRKGVAIPEEVEKESIVKGTFDALLIRKRIDEGKIQVKKARDKKTGKFMEDFNIDLEEAEAIMLALQENAILGTDDKNAINACRLLKIPFTTAIDILIRTKEKEFITKEQARKKLEILSLYGRYKKEIIEDAKRRLE